VGEGGKEGKNTPGTIQLTDDMLVKRKNLGKICSRGDTMRRGGKSPSSGRGCGFGRRTRRKRKRKEGGGFSGRGRRHPRHPLLNGREEIEKKKGKNLMSAEREKANSPGEKARGC